MCILFFSILSTAHVQSQTYGNEWIEPYVLHIKIKVPQDGIYRISYFDLVRYFADAHLDLRDLHTDKIRMFNKGKEVPIYISNDYDHRLSLGDYVEFIGHKNDGALDSGLYEKASYQRHQHLSFISDTNYYYLTVRNTGTPLRYVDYVDFSPAGTPKKFHKYTELFLEDQYYYTGKNILVADKEAQLSEYLPGEGSYGDIFSAGSDSSAIQYTVTLSSKGVYRGSEAFKPYLTSGIIGWSGYYGALSHRIIYKVGPSFSSIRRLGDTSFIGPMPINRTFGLKNSDLGDNNTYLYFYPYLDQGIPFSLYGHSHTELTYPKVYNLFDTSKYSYEEDTFKNKTYFKWERYGKNGFTKPMVFDEVNGVRAFPTYNSSDKSMGYYLPPASKKGKIFIADSSTMTYIIEKQMTAFTFPRYDSFVNIPDHYMIVTSSRLRAGNVIDDYANYRSTNYNVNTFDFENLADAFSYGVLHPLAIRKFCQYLYDKSNKYKPEHLFLIGRGYELIYNRGLYKSQAAPFMDRNFIPTFGYPASDNMFTSGFGTTTLEPAIKVGRLPVDNVGEINDYLNKVLAYESPANQYQDWQKVVMHLGGGATDLQSKIISDNLKFLESYVNKDPFAGSTVTYSRTAISSVDATQTVNLVERITRGVNLVTFLGHGSSQVTDIDMGDVTKYGNIGRYPIFYFNGCQIGNPCKPMPLSTLAFPEKLMKGQNKGAVAFLAQSSLSELYTVASQMNYFYQAYFDTSTQARTIGEVMQKHISKWQQPNNLLNKAHCRQLFLQGDPALRINIMDKPDLAVVRSSVFLDPPTTHALSDSFRVGIVVYNYGRGTDQNFRVRLERTYPNQLVKRYFEKDFQIHGFQDTIYFTIYSKDPETEGSNLFKVELNTDRRLIEYTYINNTVIAEKYLEGNGVNLISPRRFEIIAKDSVTLMAQGANLLTEEAYHFSLDTTPWFNSPVKIENAANQPVLGRVFASVKWPLKILKDSQTYFWRARIQGPTGNVGQWKQGSFTYIKNHNPGWMQSQSWQYIQPSSNNTLEGLKVDTIKRKFKFQRVVKDIYMDCWYGHTSNLGVKEGGFGAQDLNYGVCKQGIVCIPWNGSKLVREPVNPAIVQPDCQWGRAWPTFGNPYPYLLYYAFDFSQSQDRTNFVNFVNALPDSFYVTMYTNAYGHLDKADLPVINAFRKLGLTFMDSVQNRVENASYVALGKKGAATGKGQEAIAYGDSVRLIGKMYGETATGYMNSENIGPTNNFDKVYFTSQTFNQTDTLERDIVSVDVYASDRAGQSVLFKLDQRTSPIDIKDIDTKTYPFVKLIANIRDQGKNTPPNMVNWRVTFDEMPEGSLYPLTSMGYKLHNDTLYEGDTMHFAIPFKNISKIPFRDSLLVEYSIQNKITRKLLVSGSKKFKALLPDEYFLFELSAGTVGLDGPYELNVSVNPKYAQPERTLSNNSRIFNYYVVKDRMNPLLDVTFDGRHILNGDIVSANPTVLISSKDENKYLWQTDTQKMELYLVRPGTSTPEKVIFGTDAIYYAATSQENRSRVEYKPKDLPSGLYTLRVQSTDASNNKAGRTEYEITFNVVREQMATHFYPYPNPFTSKMRFVFTLTGTDIPDDIKVKITNAEGRVVKEVNKNQLGALHIGNNISEWSWDGTDEFGDKLANGVYFYRVTVSNKGEEVKLMATKGDNSFKESVGTIYLMR